jgi:hypothetical protein
MKHAIRPRTATDFFDTCLPLPHYERAWPTKGVIYMPNKPEKNFALGTVQAAVFVNKGESGRFRTVSVDRRYKDKDTGEWKSSNSFTASQLTNCVAVCQKALDYIIEKKASE